MFEICEVCNCRSSMPGIGCPACFDLVTTYGSVGLNGEPRSVTKLVRKKKKNIKLQNEDEKPAT